MREQSNIIAESVRSHWALETLDLYAVHKLTGSSEQPLRAAYLLRNFWSIRSGDDHRDGIHAR